MLRPFGIQSIVSPVITWHTRPFDGALRCAQSMYGVGLSGFAAPSFCRGFRTPTTAPARHRRHCMAMAFCHISESPIAECAREDGAVDRRKRAPVWLPRVPELCFDCFVYARVSRSLDAFPAPGHERAVLVIQTRRFRSRLNVGAIHGRDVVPIAARRKARAWLGWRRGIAHDAVAGQRAVRDMHKAGNATAHRPGHTPNFVCMCSPSPSPPHEAAAMTFGACAANLHRA